MNDYKYFRFNSTHHNSFETRVFLPQHASIIPEVKAKHLPKIYDGKLIISQAKGEIVCIDIDTQKTLWSFSPLNTQQADWINGFEVILDDKNDIILALENELNKIDLETGNLISTSKLPSQTIPDFKIDHFQGNKLYSTYSSINAGTFKFYLYCYDADKNKIQWQVDLKEDVPLASVLIENILVMFLSSNKILAYNADNGKVFWKINSQGTYIDEVEDNQQQRVIDSIPVVVENRLIFGLTDKLLRAYDVNNGKQLWETSIQEKASGNYVIDEVGNIHVISSQHYYCLDSKNGNITNKKDVKSHLENKGFNFFTMPTITNQYLFFAERFKGNLFALDINSGDIVWDYKCKSQIPKTHFPLFINSRMYIVDDQGGVYVFSE